MLKTSIKLLTQVKLSPHVCHHVSSPACFVCMCMCVCVGSVGAQCTPSKTYAYTHTHTHTHTHRHTHRHTHTHTHKQGTANTRAIKHKTSRNSQRDITAWNRWGPCEKLNSSPFLLWSTRGDKLDSPTVMGGSGFPCTCGWVQLGLIEIGRASCRERVEISA